MGLERAWVGVPARGVKGHTPTCRDKVVAGGGGGTELRELACKSVNCVGTRGVWCDAPPAP